MDAATVAAGLERPRKTTGGWEACCPAHEDKSPSLSVTDGEKGLVVHCHAGCSQQSVIDSLKGLELWPEKAVSNGSSRKQIVAEYDYVSDKGELVYQVVRYFPKDFRQRQPSEAGGFTWNLKGVDRVLYNLPEVLASEKGICIVEGEKDADALGAIGVVATTCAGGAERWQERYNVSLRNKKVFILPDNDEPGRLHAESVAKSLTGVAALVKVICLPGLPEKGDVSDWLAAGGTKNGLGKLINDSPAFIPKEVEKKLGGKIAPNLPDSPESPDWTAQLMSKDDGSLVSNINNAQSLMAYHPAMAGIIGYNQFSKSVALLAQPPWEQEPSKYPRSLTDVDDTRATAWLERHGVKLTINTVHAAIVSAAHHNPFHPLQEYLQGLKWDGHERLTQAMQRLFGAEDNPYTQAVSRRFLVGAVARALDPGCKMDTMLILEGGQGIMKSSGVSALFSPTPEEWFSDELADMGSKDSAMQVQGIWAIEVAELATMHRAESNRLKEWLTRRVDRFRPPYGRNVLSSPRQCVLVGTVNPGGGYLKDETGGRRFWPVRCGAIDIERIEAERDQVWAEAVSAYSAGEKWWFEAEERSLGQAEQEDRYESDPWEEDILGFVATREVVSVREIMSHLDIPQAQRTQMAQTRIAKILVSNGRMRRQRRMDGKRLWVYVISEFSYE